jgi:hypothetical protein
MEKLEESVDFHDLDVCGQLGDIYDLRSAGSD